MEREIEREREREREREKEREREREGEIGNCYNLRRHAQRLTSSS
jgi:hypothetical protein